MAEDQLERKVEPQEPAEPVACTETELHDAEDKGSALTCRLVGEHAQHEALTPNGGVLKWPDVEPEAATE